MIARQPQQHVLGKRTVRTRGRSPRSSPRETVAHTRKLSWLAARTHKHPHAALHTHTQKHTFIINKSTAAPAPSLQPPETLIVLCARIKAREAHKRKKNARKGASRLKRSRQVGVTYHFLTGFDLWTLPKIT